MKLWPTYAPHEWRWLNGSFTLDRSNMNIPRVRAFGDETGCHAFLSLEWGNGNSGPFWCLTQRIRVPRLIGQRLPY